MRLNYFVPLHVSESWFSS